MITPRLRYYASISLYGVLKTVVTSVLVLAVVAYVAWRAFLFEQWVEDVEFEANVDANKALEELEDDGAKKGGKKGKGKGKGKQGEEVDKLLEG